MVATPWQRDAQRPAVGINEQVEFVGMDSLQALEMVSKVERYLAGFSQKYDFYWMTGEPYFDE